MGLHDGHRQRMKERFARHGLDSFAEHEVLELLLYYAIPRRDTNELAHTLLDRFGSLERVLLAPREELMKVPGVGEGAALLLTLVPAVSQYTHRHAPQETILNSVDASGWYFMRLLRHERRELLYQACLDGKGKLLSCRCLSEGGVNMAAVTLRQIVEHALISSRWRRAAFCNKAKNRIPFGIRFFALLAHRSEPRNLCVQHTKIHSLRAECFLRRTRCRKKTDFSLFAAFRPRTL